jgi:hypothetical protein
MIDEMKTSMHRMIVRCALHVLQEVLELAYNVDLTMFLVFMLQVLSN